MIVGANVAGPAGSLDGAHQSYTIAANQQITAADAYRNIVIAYRNNAPVLLKDVAEVIDGLENNKVGAWYNGQHAIVVDIQRQPGANVVETVQRIQRELPRLQRAFPAGVELTVVHDATNTIRASIRDVQFTLVLSIALVILVVFIFLRTIRATIIAGVALPLSLIATFGVMWFCGFSLDNLSLMALTIGTGFVVDDAIVMIENVVRHMEEGETPFQAALKGASEIGFTIISLTLSLIAVFIPLLFMTGLVGRMFREFALTLTIAVVVSAIISLTLTPMMCSRMLRPHVESAGNAVTRFFNNSLEATIEYYRRTLEWVLRHEALTLIVLAATMAATFWLYIVIPKGFLPQQDTGLIFAVMEGGDEVSFTEMQRLRADRRGDDPQGPRGGGRGFGRRRHADQRHAERGAVCDHAAAARRAAHLGDDRDRAAPAGDAAHPRRDPLFPAGAGHPDRDPHQPRAVPVHPHRHQRRGGGPVGRAAGGAAARLADHARCRLRGAG